MPQQVRVFVSHHHSPTEDTFTGLLVRDLERAQADVWVDKNEIQPGEDFQSRINSGLLGRQYLVLVMTPAALASKWVRQEVAAANALCNNGQMRGIIPVIAEPCSENDIPPLWGTYLRLDATKDYTAARDALLRTLGLQLPVEHEQPVFSFRSQGGMKPNEEICGCRVVEPIGNGNMAIVYKAEQIRVGNRTVAIKIVYCSDPKSVRGFQREVSILASLSHPNIVHVFDSGVQGDFVYLVVEFMTGGDLRKYLKRQGFLTPERAVAIAHDVALGLGCIHDHGIVHCNVKPEDILLNDYDGLAKLSDFGNCVSTDHDEIEYSAITSMSLETVRYYAPEQAQGKRVTPASDIYMLGIVMYEMLTGTVPFDGNTPVAVAMRHIQDIPEPPSHLNPAIPHKLEWIILRCLEKDPRNRYLNGNELVKALDQYQQGR